jgi:catechol-2,3-dioxygenase
MPPKNLDFSHFGFFVKNLDRMREFYTETLGFHVTDEGIARGRPIVFLSRNPEEHHQLVLVEGRDDDESLVINQISLRAGGLDDLRDVRDAVEGQGDITHIDPVDHGTAWSLYFRDPEGNRVEIFVDTPWYVAQPRVDPLDLSMTDEEIGAATLKLIENEPTFKPAEDWKQEFKSRLGAA